MKGFEFWNPTKNRNFRKMFVTWPTRLFQWLSVAANSFFDLTTRIDSHNRKKNCRKILRHQNKFADFEKFGGEHPSRPKSTLATNCANHPGGGITLRQNRSTSHIRDASAQRAAPGRAGKIYGSARREHVQAKFSIFDLQQKFDFWDENFEILVSWKSLLGP